MGDARSGTRNTADLGSDRPEGVKSESNPLIKSQQAKKGTSFIDKIVIICHNLGTSTSHLNH